MKKSLGWTKERAFINRSRELVFLGKWISEEPDSLLFIFGPKSSGKTTLLTEFINRNLPDSNYDIKHFNLRKIFIVNYQHFIQTFFSLDYSKAREDVKERRQYNLKVFQLTVDTLKGLEQKNLDPFAVMERELEKTIAGGIRPVIIIDELQALESIYLNGQRELLKELFNFFVAMTKESHLCHVIIASSDGYFIERIYNDSKLKKTSRFLEVDYLDKEDVLFWLNDLAGQSKIKAFTLSDSQIVDIWDTLGGSCWEISAFLGDLLRVAEKGQIADEHFTELIEKKKITARSMFVDYAGLDPQKTGLFRKLSEIIKVKSSIELRDLAEIVADGLYAEPDLRKELSELVRQNFLAYNPVTAEYTVQGRSMEHGLRMFVEMMDEW
ncbi:MAG: ATP-binding protein [Bacteroidota bacterium]|nr:ATP-binding protein [Bacteroidota bacterium]